MCARARECVRVCESVSVCACLCLSGSAISGLCAALTVLDRGGRVCVLEKRAHLGGNSALASSGISAVEEVSLPRPHPPLSFLCLFLPLSARPPSPPLPPPPPLALFLPVSVSLSSLSRCLSPCFPSLRPFLASQHLTLPPTLLPYRPPFLLPMHTPPLLIIHPPTHLPPSLPPSLPPPFPSPATPLPPLSLHAPAPTRSRAHRIGEELVCTQNRCVRRCP